MQIMSLGFQSWMQIRVFIAASASMLILSTYGSPTLSPTSPQDVQGTLWTGLRCS